MIDLFDLQNNPRPLSVSEVNARMKAFANSMGEIEVSGEISGCRGAGTSGHLYFSLKDAAGTPSLLSVAIWRSNAMRLRVLPRDGMKVVLTGRLDVYEPRGTYQLIATKLREEGKGDLMAQFEALKAKLTAEGLFDVATKRAIPAFVKKVAFVTAPSGAVIHDFCQILRNHHFAGTVILVPAKVQGAGAAEEIVRGIQLANKIRDLDLLVVGRGGGSLEDLWCFNEEILARAVKASRVPVISAVGHETDFTLCDFAADKRAETPSAAAQIIAQAQNDLRERLEDAAGTLEQATENYLNLREQDLEMLALRLEKQAPHNYLRNAALKMETLKSRLNASRERVFARAQQQFANLQARFDAQNPQNICKHHATLLKQLEARLRASGLESTLNRGFAAVFEAEKNIPITSAGTAKMQKTLRIRFKDGEIEK